MSKNTIRYRRGRIRLANPIETGLLLGQSRASVPGYHAASLMPFCTIQGVSADSWGNRWERLDEAQRQIAECLTGPA
jgi:hypothetical protein